MLVQFNNQLFRVLSDEGNTYSLLSNTGEVLDDISKAGCREVNFAESYQALKDARGTLTTTKTNLQEIIDEIPQIAVYQKEIEDLKHEVYTLEQQLRTLYGLEPIGELPEGVELGKKLEWVYDEPAALKWMVEHYPHEVSFPKGKFESKLKTMSPEDKKKLGVSRFEKISLVVKKEE